MIVRGTTQQSTYIAGQYGVVEGGRITSTLKHDEWMARRALEDVVIPITRSRQLDQRTINQMATDFHGLMGEAPELVPPLAAGGHAGLDEYINFRQNIMRLRTPQGGVVSDFEYAALMRAGGAQGPGGFVRMWPGGSASQIAGGVAELTDVSAASSWFPGAADWGRRPARFIRREYQPTREAAALMAGDPYQQRMGWARRPTGVQSPMMRVAYVSSSFGQNLNRFGVSAEGQALISSNMSGMRAVQGLRQFSIASDSLVDIKPGDVGRGIGFSLSQGALLGYGPDGRPVTAPHDLQVLQVTAFENDPSKGNFVRVMASHDITEFPQSQVIGGTKGMAPEVSQGYIDKVMRGIGAADLQGVSAVITMDDLKKERHLHYEQMFTSLWEYTQANMQGGKQFSGLNMPVGSDFHSWAEKARAFEADPSREIAAIHKAATQADKFDHDLVLRELVQRARGADLTATQFGHVFGAVPEVFDMGTNAGTWYGS
jgi:hypothetical protein